MISAAGGTAEFEGGLESWKYCKLGTDTFSYIWDILGIILSGVSCKYVKANM